VVAVHDNPYSEIAYDGYQAPSFLQTDGAKEVGVEMHSLSKTYNMTGWRIGMACGSADVISGLGTVKTNVDSGVFNAVQHAGIAALTGPQDCVCQACAVYQERRDLLVRGCLNLDMQSPLQRRHSTSGWRWRTPWGSPQRCSRRRESSSHQVSVSVVLGKAFVRFALTRPVERIREALSRMEKVKG